MKPRGADDPDEHAYPPSFFGFLAKNDVFGRFWPFLAILGDFAQKPTFFLLERVILPKKPNFGLFYEIFWNFVNN
jgi:hypothetical protein